MCFWGPVVNFGCFFSLPDVMIYSLRPNKNMGSYKMDFEGVDHGLASRLKYIQNLIRKMWNNSRMKWKTPSCRGKNFWFFRIKNTENFIEIRRWHCAKSNSRKELKPFSHKIGFASTVPYLTVRCKPYFQRKFHK